MRFGKKVLSVLLAALMLFSCSSVAFAASPTVAEPHMGMKGTLNCINYNVAGLPIPPSETSDGKDAFADSFLVGMTLNNLNYDIVAIQEDFNYDMYLRDQMTNYPNTYDERGNVLDRHQTDHSGGVPLGDGMNIFSKYSLYNCKREAWKVSAGILDDGSDELTYKGIQVTTIEVAKGYYVDIYNVHMDAYGGEASVNARHEQFNQLASFIKKNSVYDPTTGVYDHAVIVTGDFNSHIFLENEGHGDMIVTNLLEPCKLNDAWAVTTLENVEEDPVNYNAYYDYAERTNMTEGAAWGHYDSVERFCYAGGNGIDLSVTDFRYTKICDATGRSFSDHSAAIAGFEWTIVEKVQDLDHNHGDTDIDQDDNFLIRFLKYIASIFRTLGLLLQGLAKRNPM